jgi:hypothetical protein
MIHVPLLNTILTAGDFVFARRNRDAYTPSVCVIRDIAEYNQVKVTWWLTIDELDRLGNVDPPLCFLLNHIATF